MFVLRNNVNQQLKEKHNQVAVVSMRPTISKMLGTWWLYAQYTESNLLHTEKEAYFV